MAQEIPAGAAATPITYVPHPDHAGPLAKLDGSKAYHYATDHLGTPQEVYDENQQIVWAADLRAYGKTRRYLKHAIDNPIRFPGQYFDVESGLHYNRFRYYDPETGRYVNQDPIGLRGGVNSYVYANNLPVLKIDPKGLEAATAGAVIGTAIEPGGGTIVGAIIGAIVDALTVSAVVVGAGAALSSDTAKDCPSNKKPCPPCKTVSGKIIPVGTIGYRFDAVPPGRPHYPYTGSHYNLYRANQIPASATKATPCDCFWQEFGAADGAGGLPPPAGAVPIEPFA
jgi:type VI secretion system secreted protein VgrG